MLKIKTFSSKGVLGKEVDLPKDFSGKFSPDLVKQAVKVLEDRTHFGLARVKTRSEVNRTKKKLYKQKGTGGARHGAKSAPIFVGGGKAHGPKGVKRSLQLPLKMRKIALKAAISFQIEKGRVYLVEDLAKVEKTSAAAKIVDAIKKTLNYKAKVLLVLSKESMKTARFFKNIKKLEVLEYGSLNALKVLRSSLTLFESKIFTKNEDKVKTAKKAVKKEK